MQLKLCTVYSLPRFGKVEFKHDYEARQKRDMENAAKQKEYAKYMDQQKQVQQPHYGRGHHHHHPQNASNMQQQPHSVNRQPQQQPQHRAGGFQHHQNQHYHQSGSSNKRSNQGLTKGFALVAASASSNNPSQPPK